MRQRMRNMGTGLELRIFSMDCMNFCFVIYIRDFITDSISILNLKQHGGKARAESDLYPPGLLCIVLEKDGRHVYADDSTPRF